MEELRIDGIAWILPKVIGQKPIGIVAEIWLEPDHSEFMTIGEPKGLKADSLEELQVAIQNQRDVVFLPFAKAKS